MLFTIFINTEYFVYLRRNAQEMIVQKHYISTQSIEASAVTQEKLKHNNNTSYLQPRLKYGTN